MKKWVIMILVLLFIVITCVILFFYFNKKEESEKVMQEDYKKAVFNFDTKTVKLNSGYEMPLNGLGTYSLTGDTCYDSVISALKVGVRLFDTVYMYGNEEEVGRAIRDYADRKNVVIATKLFYKMGDGPNREGLSRKAIMQEFDAMYDREQRIIYGD